MKVYKKITRDFTVCSNHIHKHKLSLKAIGLYLYIISKPDAWDFSISGTASQVSDGKDSIRSAISELENIGFLERNRVRRDDGTYGDGVWFVYDRVSDKPVSENPTLDNPTLDKPPQVSTKKENTKKEKVNFSSERISSSPNPTKSFKEETKQSVVNPELLKHLEMKKARKQRMGVSKPKRRY